MPSVTVTSPFHSFFMAGFESSSHRLPNASRLDLLAATQHIRFASQDFRRLRQQQLYTARSAVRWHVIETAPGTYDFSSLLPYLRAVKSHRMQVIWDLCHYGYPDELDPFSPAFVTRFAKFARVVARFISDETDGNALFCPVNEPSFWSWAGGDVGYLNPFEHGRGFELKKNLIRASLAATEAIWSVLPDACIVTIDPIIHIAAPADRPDLAADAEGHRLAQYQSWDMISGRMCPELGGTPDHLGTLGVNYYASNQWLHGQGVIGIGHPQHRPLSAMLTEVYERYQRPLFIAETGAEGDARAGWLRHIVDETVTALQAGVPVQGICLYPILNYPGWDDQRHCPAGLWDYATPAGDRPIDHALARELRTSRMRVAAALDTPSQGGDQGETVCAIRPPRRREAVYSHSHTGYVVLHDFI